MNPQIHNPFIARAKYDVLIAHAPAISFYMQPMGAEDPYFKEYREILKPQTRMTTEGVAVIPLQGMLCRRPDICMLQWGDVEDTLEIEELVKKAAIDPNVKAIVIDCDSPGGYCLGTPELATAVRVAAAQKPVIAWAGGLACSAAYWIISQASAIVASESAVVGSIGALNLIVDDTEYYKNAGINFEVMRNTGGELKAPNAYNSTVTPEQKQEMQDELDSIFDTFKSTVIEKRKQCSADCFTGKTFIGQQAKTAGLVDAIGSLDYAIAVALSI